MKENKITLKNVIFDKSNKTMTILKGDEGTYPYTEINKCQILFEDYRFSKKTSPFTHNVLVASFQPINMLEGKVLVGIRIWMNDGSKVHIYVSDEPIVIRSEKFFSDEKEAKAIKQLIDKIINKYQRKEMIL